MPVTDLLCALYMVIQEVELLNRIVIPTAARLVVYLGVNKFRSNL